MTIESNARSWITIAPLGGLATLPKELRLPFLFADDISLHLLPGWIRTEAEDQVDLLKPRLLQTIIDKKITHCLLVKYEADALGSPDPKWQGEAPRSIQETAIESIHLVILAMWLAHPTGMHFQNIAHCEKSGPDWIVRQFGDFLRVRPLTDYQYERIELEDIERACRLYDLLRKMPAHGPVFSAICSLGLALAQQGWPLRYLVFWLALEALFGPDDPRETTYRISQRIAFFLADDGQKRRDIFTSIKKSYMWRSKIVHGRRLSKLTDEASADLISRLEHTVRQSIFRILEDNELMDIFSGERRETYLDNLIFAQHS